MAEFFAGFLAAFALGTFWFWAASVVAFLFILFFEEHENNVGAVIVLAIFIFLMESSGAFNLFVDPWMLIKWTALYFVIGAAWSFLKWFSFLNSRADEFKLHKERFAKLSRAGDPPDYGTVDEPSDVFKKYLEDKRFINNYGDDRRTIIPTARDYLDKLSTWILWWPFSAFWTILNDPLVRLAKAIVRQLNSWYDGIANRVFAKFN